MIKVIAFLLLFVSSSVEAYSWSTVTKRIKTHTLMQAYPTGLYSGCLITKEWKIDRDSCPVKSRYKPRTNIHQEHIVPASAMATHLNCGILTRSLCQRYVPKFKECHNNRLNLFPVLSTINLYRNNMKWTELKDSETFFPFGKEVGIRKHIKERLVEPPKRLKRLIGLTYLRMESLDCVKLEPLDRLIYQRWSES